MRNRSKTHVLFITLILSTLYFSCSRKDIIPSFDYAPFISAYTGGIISYDAPIRIEFTQEIPNVTPGKEVNEKLFKFSPHIKGKAYWVNNQAIEFIPDNGQLRRGKQYKGTFALGKIVRVKRKLEKFHYSFRVKEFNFSTNIDQIVIPEENPNKVSVSGLIFFSESIEIDMVEKMISAKIDNQKIEAVVTPNETPNSFRYSFSNIAKKDKEQKLKISIDGKPAKINNSFDSDIAIPAINTFDLISAKSISQPENGIKLLFTEPISSLQDLNGLINIENIYSDIIYQKNDNEIILFFENQNTKSLKTTIDENLKSSNGHILNKNISIDIPIELMAPKIELLSDGVIMPNSEQLIIPFQTIGLKAVEIEIVKIYENNILMFLQTNSLSESSELKRAGRLIYKRTLRLNATSSYIWENYSIDLKELIKQEPGAIYQVKFSFKQNFTLPPFNNNPESYDEVQEGMVPITENELSEQDEKKWDYDSYYGFYSIDNDEYNWNEYEWDERNNPYHASFYMNSENTTVTTNVLASNLGLMAKNNDNNEYWISVTNLLEAKPVINATVTLYNAQIQKIAETNTDENGFAYLKTKQKAFIAVAALEKEKTYLKLIDGEENSTSRFDVGGEKISRGLKGFIYGERGVWRPGDTLFLSFILEDKEDRIPDNHPVTLELFNPRGQFAYKKISTNGIDGLYTFAISTQPDAPTGLWDAYVKVGSSTFHKSVRIENIKPNRLKIDLKFSSDFIRNDQKEIPIKLSAMWLTGATAHNLNTTVEMTLYKAKTQFKGYEKYIFENPATDFTTKSSKVFSGKIDSQGKVDFKLKNSISENAPGMIKAQFTSRVFEAGGDASTRTQTITISPFKRYVGINFNENINDPTFETDKIHSFNVVTLNENGTPINVQGVEYLIYKIEWSWWWENNYEDFSSYVNNSSIKPIQKGTINTVNGKGIIRFDVKYPEWGRYLVFVKDREGGHATGGIVYVDWPSWRGRSQKDDPSAIKMLSFSTDKRNYQPGEKATVIIPHSKTGAVLLSIENGRTILKREWIKMNKEGDTKYSFTVTEDMSPNVYIHVCMLQPHSQTVNDLPIRMYGIQPIFVVNKKSILKPIITAPAVVRPETSFTVKVKEEKGQPMTYTLAIVDNGLLDLTNFTTPDPWNHFYAREALGLRTWDMFDDVVGAYTGKFGALFSIGGDQDTKKSNRNNTNRFKPVVKFIGPFKVGKGKTNTHTLKLPQYIGSVRIMVVACHDGAYGSAEKEMIVRSPLMILSTLPRVISTNETIELPVNIFALEKEMKNVTVSVKTSGNLKVVSKASQSTKFTAPGDKILYFTLQSNTNTGPEKIIITASGNGKSAKEVINIEVRNPNPPLTQIENVIIPAGQSHHFKYNLAQYTPENNLLLEVSRLPSIDLSRRLDFLSNYPHYCSEQIVSKAIPLLYVSHFKEIPKEEKIKIENRVKDAINTIYTRQLANGGFAYWSSDRYVNSWITSYVGNFLILAKEKGYEVNNGVINKWISYQRREAQSWQADHLHNSRFSNQQSDLEQAYRLYTLALANSPQMGAMNRLKENKSLSLQARWTLAAAYGLSGKTSTANDLIFNAKSSVESYSTFNATYGSSLRDDAIILDALLILGKDKMAFEQAQIISNQLMKENLFSTQSTAFALMAMGKLSKKLSGSLVFDWSYNGKKENVKSAKSVFQKSLIINNLKGEIVVTNHGKGNIYANVVSRTKPQTDSLPAMSNNLNLDVQYTDMNGAKINITQLPKGSDIYAIIKVINTSPSIDYTDLALTHIIPSGWEIYNERLYNEDENNTNKTFDYQDIKDDRIITYFDLKRNSHKTIKVRIQASYGGDFILPAISCEAMYAPNCFARNKAGRVTVK